MSPPPPSPRIYHITHVANLRRIVEQGGLMSDAGIMAAGGPPAAIGMSGIKQRRLTLPVDCHSPACVGDFVPFYFCPRSIMLFVIHCANHADLAYRGGQGPIVHLQADLHSVIAWASGQGRPWAFSLSNAGAVYTEFRNRIEDLDQLDWEAIAAVDFRAKSVKESKQAEFLLHGSFPWSLVTEVGVHSAAVAAQGAAAIGSAAHRPPVRLRPEWYF
jgi:hypothetical protein